VITPQALTDELDLLGEDLALLIPTLREQAVQLVADTEVRSATRVIVVGHGDSYISGVAAEMAFSSAMGVQFSVMHSQYFLDYASHWLRSPATTLVIGVTASGGTERTVQAIESARTCGSRTLAVTGSRGSWAAAVADHVMLAELPNRRPSPGIRTYQASVTALLMLALVLHGSEHLLEEITRLPPMVGATVKAARASCDSIAASIADASSLTLAGTGPSYSSALYGAAKMTEAAGLPASARDLEEWWHVERFQRPSGLPLIVIAAPGHSRSRALELSRRARALGRRVITVAANEDCELIAGDHAVIPVCGEASEELSPLVYHIFAGTLAAAIARSLGRNPFETDSEDPGVI
jgi:glutamine---fructose-6-phosphate transaminase (isomerizing)